MDWKMQESFITMKINALYYKQLAVVHSGKKSKTTCTNLWYLEVTNFKSILNLPQKKTLKITQPQI